MTDTASAVALRRLRDSAFKGAGKRLADGTCPALPRHRLRRGTSCTPSWDVESLGGGFDSKGRPKALIRAAPAYALSQGAVRTPSS